MSVESLASELKKIVSSRYFFYFILLLAALQGLWYAFSFLPSLFDESKHLGRIIIYSNQLQPWITEQRVEWDHLSAIPRDPFYVFYYLMSWPLRFIRLFTQDVIIQTIFLRIINITFFVTGLVFYRKALLATKKINIGIINTALLVLVLTPSIAPLLGAVNYDNLVFLLFAILLLNATRTITQKNINFETVAKILIIGLFMVLIKWNSVALFAPLIAYVSYDLYRKHKKNSIHKLRDSIRTTSTATVMVATLGLIIATALIIERPVINTIIYGSPDIKCNQIISHERCLKHRDYEVYNNVANNKPGNFDPVSIGQYSLMYWIPRMINTSVSLLPWQAARNSPALPVISTLYSLFALSSVVLVLVNLKELLKSKTLKLLMFVAACYTGILVLFLYSAYVKFAIPAAISSRYLLPIFPIIISLSILSAVQIFNKQKAVLIAALVIVLIMFTQGGGIITHLLTAQDRLYWNNNSVKVINYKIRTIVEPLVKE